MKMESRIIKTTFFSVLLATTVSLAGCTSDGDETDGTGQGSTSPSSNDTPADTPPGNNEGSGDANQPAPGSSGAPASDDGSAANRFNGRTRGRVEQINTDGSLLVLGQTVFITDTTVLVNTAQSQIVVGDWLDIDGQMDGNGNVFAASIDLDLDLDSTVVVTGLISALDVVAGVLKIGNLTVAIGQLDFSSLGVAVLTNGLVIVITADYGDYNSGNVSISASGISVTQSDGTSVAVSTGANAPVVEPPETQSPTETDTGSGADTQAFRLSGTSSCLTVGENATFQVSSVSGDLVPGVGLGVGLGNLNSLASVTSGSGDSLSVISAGDAGISITMSRQDIVGLEITAGNTSIKQYIGALDASVQRPVILAKQTGDWCSYILFEDDNCLAITNASVSVPGVTINAASPVGLGSVNRTTWNRILDSAASVSTGSKITVDGCTLDNPANIPLLTIN